MPILVVRRPWDSRRDSAEGFCTLFAMVGSVEGRNFFIHIRRVMKKLRSVALVSTLLCFFVLVLNYLNNVMRAIESPDPCFLNIFYIFSLRFRPAIDMFYLGLFVHSSPFKKKSSISATTDFLPREEGFTGNAMNPQLVSMADVAKRVARATLWSCFHTGGRTPPLFPHSFTT